MTHPSVSFFCATYLKPEMLHVWRQIRALDDCKPHVITQKVENLPQFPVDSLHVVPRSKLRWVARWREKQFGRGPWQVSRRETRDVMDFLNESQSSVIHIFFGNVAVHWLELLREVKIPVVVSFHGADVTGAIAGESYRHAREQIFARADVIACRSRALADRVQTLGAPKEKIHLHRTLIPVGAQFCRSPDSARSQRIVQASRLIPKKGISTTLRAFAQVAAAFPGSRLVIAGDGPMEGELRALTRELGISNRVEFTGFLDQSALTRELAQAAIFVHPSESVHGDTEGVPNSLLEAMAAGVPVVATRHGGIEEAIRDAETGILIDERDVDALSRAMTQLLSDPEANIRIGEAGWHSVKAEFSTEARRKELSRWYQELCRPPVT